MYGWLHCLHYINAWSCSHGNGWLAVCGPSKVAGQCILRLQIDTESFLTRFATHLRQAGTDQKNDVDEEALEQHSDEQTGQQGAHDLKVKIKIDLCQEKKRHQRRSSGDGEETREVSPTSLPQSYVLWRFVVKTRSNAGERGLEISLWHFFDGQDCSRLGALANVIHDTCKEGKNNCHCPWTRGLSPHLDEQPPKTNILVVLELTCWCFDCIHLSGLTFQWPPSWRYTERARWFHNRLSRSASSPDLRDTDTHI